MTNLQFTIYNQSSMTPYSNTLVLASDCDIENSMKIAPGRSL